MANAEAKDDCSADQRWAVNGGGVGPAQQRINKAYTSARDYNTVVYKKIFKEEHEVGLRLNKMHQIADAAYDKDGVRDECPLLSGMLMGLDHI